jgi:hypothetical protein
VIRAGGFCFVLFCFSLFFSFKYEIGFSFFA